MKKKSTLAALLAVCLLASAGMTACGDDAEKGTEQKDNSSSSEAVTEAGTEPEDTAVRVSDVLPEELDFGGMDIRFIVELGWDGFDDIVTSIFVEEDSADVVQSAVYNRNLAVSDWLNANIVITKESEVKGLVKDVRKVIRSGDDEYDVVAAYRSYSVAASAMNFLYDMNDVQYVDYTQPWWATKYIEGTSYNGVYWLTGDITYLYTGGMETVFCNKRLLSNLALDENIYDVVRNGEWTVDRMLEYATMTYRDLNNNGVTDIEDQLGIFTKPGGISAGCNLRASERNADGVPVLNFMTEHTANVWEKVYNAMRQTEGVLNPSGTDYSNHVGQFFAQGNTLFIVESIASVIEEMRDMNDDYYILPPAKYDENQDSYYSSISSDVTIFGIPITCTHVDETGAVLEAMAIESYRLLRPAYYETALKEKYSRDPESAEMLDLLRDSVYEAFASVYSESIGGGIGSTGKGINRLFDEAYEKDMNSIASLYEKNASKYEKNMQALIDAFDAQAEQ